jgi:hypothetical protein
VGRLLGVAAVMALGSGCSDEACFTWSAQEGACPAQGEAMQFFVPQGCYGGIASVDSDGEFVEDDDSDEIASDLCCYSVTKSEEEYTFCDGGGGEF